MIVQILNHQSTLSIDSRSVRKLVREVIAFEGKNYDEVAIHFVEMQEISELHNKFFNDPSPTDCISFPVDDENLNGSELYCVMGDLFVCPATAVEYGSKHQKDPYEEVTLYIVHGLLHLMGYDDLDILERKEMRKAEKKQMLHLKKLNLWLKENACI